MSNMEVLDVRAGVVVLALLLLASCSSGHSSAAPTPTTRATDHSPTSRRHPATTTPAKPATKAKDSCGLLTDAEASAFLGESAHAERSAIEECQWEVKSATVGVQLDATLTTEALVANPPPDATPLPILIRPARTSPTR
jgi:hypothetical protein